MKTKKFDAVKMTRDIREKLSKEYFDDPEAFLKRLEKKHAELKKVVSKKKRTKIKE